MCTIIFTSLPSACHHFSNGESFLRVDYSIPCNYDGAKFAYLAVLFYPVFLPAFFTLLLVVHRKAIRDPKLRGKMASRNQLTGRLRKHASVMDRISSIPINMFRQLWSAYRPQCWWFEIFDIFRRIFLAGLIVFLGDGTATQCATALLVCIVSLLVYAVAQPMQPRSANFTAIGDQLCLTLTFFMALMLKVDTSIDDPQFGTVHTGVNEQVISHTLDTLLVAVNVLPLVFPMLEFFWKRLGLDTEAFEATEPESRHGREGQRQRDGKAAGAPSVQTNPMVGQYTKRQLVGQRTAATEI